MRAQACLTICNSMDCSLPGSSAHRILWARILDRVTISSSRGSSWPQDRTHVSWVSALQANSLPLSHLRSPGCKYQQTRAITRTLFLSIVYVRAALHTTQIFLLSLPIIFEHLFPKLLLHLHISSFPVNYVAAFFLHLFWAYPWYRITFRVFFF